MSLRIERASGGLRIRQYVHGFWTAVLLLGAFGLYLAFGASYSVECDRQPDGSLRASIRSHRLGYTSAPRVVPNIRAVELETVVERTSHHAGTHVETTDTGPRVEIGRVRVGGRTRQRTSTTYRVLLVDAQGTKHAVTTYRSNTRAVHESLANQIRAFLADPSATRAVTRLPQDPVLAGILLVFALFVVLFQWLCRTEFILDPVAGTFTRIGTHAFPAASTVQLDLSEIREFTTRAVRRLRDEHRSYRLLPVVNCLDGREIRFSPFWTGSRNSALVVTQALERARIEYLQRVPRPADTPAPRVSDNLQHAAPPSAPASGPGAKICRICGLDCSDAPRYRDDDGHYMHQTCRDARG